MTSCQIPDEIVGSFEGTGIRRVRVAVLKEWGLDGVRVAVLKEQVLDELEWQF